jgi:CHAD domain-containing protein
MPSNDLTDLLKAAANDPSDKETHQLRTSLRRCEGIIKTSTYCLSAKEQGVLKRLKKVRKTAGKVRDLDIHIGLLTSEEFAGSRFNGAPEELRSQLVALREKAAKRLETEIKKALRKGTARKAQKLGRKAAQGLPTDPIAVIEQPVREIAATAKLEDAASLHEVRIALKRVRYALEAYDDPSLAETVKAIKRVHDAIGEWHDWITLADAAADHLARRSPLVLHARRKAARLFVRAVDETSRFLEPYRLKRKGPASAKPVPLEVRARA